MRHPQEIVDMGSNASVVNGPRPSVPPRTVRPRDGFSLVEVMVVVTVMGVLITMSAPSFRRSMEQAKADVAAANLRGIWSAERLYWQEYRTYTTNLATLQSLGLIDPTTVSANTVYVYTVTSASSSAFTAKATRTGSTQYSGQLTIDSAGVVSGTITATGKPNIVPGFQ